MDSEEDGYHAPGIYQFCSYEGSVHLANTGNFVHDYAIDEETWLSDFLAAWKSATDNSIVYANNPTASK